MPCCSERSCRFCARSCRSCCATLHFSMRRRRHTCVYSERCADRSYAPEIRCRKSACTYPDLVPGAQCHRCSRCHSNQCNSGARLRRQRACFIPGETEEIWTASTVAAMKWLLQNVCLRAAFAAKNPRYALNAMVREFTSADETFLARLSGSSPREIRTYLDEPINTPAFAAHLRKEEGHFRSLSIKSADLFAKKILNQYAAVRALRPDCIVETGVANGVSSSYLLLALQKNKRGHLHSIGLGDRAFLLVGRDLGWLVPEWLRATWQVHLGDARDILPRLLNRLGKIGVFIHDSLHTYDHMKIGRAHV